MSSTRVVGVPDSWLLFTMGKERRRICCRPGGSLKLSLFPRTLDSIYLGHGVFFVFENPENAALLFHLLLHRRLNRLFALLSFSIDSFSSMGRCAVSGAS